MSAGAGRPAVVHGGLGAVGAVCYASAMRTTGWWVVCGLVIVLGGCGKDEELSPCVDGDLGCGRVCGESTKPCTAGLYCSPEGLCSKACSQLPGFTCDDQAMCTLDGRCMPLDSETGGASGAGSGSGGTSGGTTGGGAMGGGAIGGVSSSTRRW
jgi:hypothetical protein